MEIGPVLALATAICYAIAVIFIRRGVVHANESFSGLVIILFSNTLIFSLAVSFTSDWDKIRFISLQGLVLLGGAGILQSVIGMYFFMTSVRLIGANKAGALVKTNILYAVILGVIVLNESLTIPFALGIVGIITGLTLVSIEKIGVNEVKQAVSTRVRVKGIATGLGAGLCWGLSVILIKPGIMEIGSPMAGVFVTYSIPFLIIASMLLRREQRERLTHLNRSALIPFIFSGVFNSAANLFRFPALSYSPVSLVMPIAGADSIFILIFSFFLNRHLEVFTWRIIVGVVAVFAGVILLST